MNLFSRIWNSSFVRRSGAVLALAVLVLAWLSSLADDDYDEEEYRKASCVKKA